MTTPKQAAALALVYGVELEPGLYMGRQVRPNTKHRVRNRTRTRPMLWLEQTGASVACGAHNWLAKSRPNFIEARVVTFQLAEVQSDE